MVGMESILSIIAIIISSMALVGVSVSLILQSRQLKASQIQVMREMHLELIKMGIDNPAVVASIYKDASVEDLPRTAVLNLTMTLWLTSYSLKTTTKEGVESQARYLFASEYARNWWASAGDVYEVEAVTKIEKEFFAIVDRTFNGVLQAQQAISQSDAAPSGAEE
jgi:hypothetical protein